MNQPEYYIVDIFEEIVQIIKTKLSLPVLNYQYGYVKELDQTLTNFEKVEEKAYTKYPLIWIRQPFVIDRNEPFGFYGTVRNFSLFIIDQSNKELRAPDRMTQKFKPIIYPIYRELLEQINIHTAIAYEWNRPHRIVDRYWWGDGQQQEITDIVDCLEVSELKLIIENNSNC